MNDRTKLRGWPRWVWILILVAEVLAVGGVLSVLAVRGVRHYVLVRRFRQARSAVQSLATGIARCAEAGLPESSAAIPSTPSTGKHYVRLATVWSAQPAFRCAGFAPNGPQYFSYQWRRESATRGAVIALADFDADGEAESRVDERVECEIGAKCSLGEIRELRPIE